MKEKLVEIIRKTKFGNYLFFRLKKTLGRLPVPDMDFSELVSLEVSSICNLSCIHCPPQLKNYKDERRKHTHINYELFCRMMDEIDKYGQRRIALHKDGEPLVHPRIIDILCRVKKNRNHIVYLTTNAHFLTKEVADEILKNGIDVINFSVGAATEKFYNKVRGKNFETVIANIRYFLSAVAGYENKPKVMVQIINLPEFKEMEEEIALFREYWKDFDVEISVWDKLSWGTFDDNPKFAYRYPCYSLWDSFYVNSNGVVTACCMDWKQQLVLGNAETSTISQMWKGDLARKLRKSHLSTEDKLPESCKKCNYWQWQPMLFEYPE